MRFVVAIVLMCSLAAPAGAAGVAWRGWNDGLTAAASSRKPMLVDVYTDWCGFCKRMDRETYARTDVSAYLNSHFVMVRLDAEGRERASYQGRALTSRTLASGFGVTGYPTTIFLRANGEHLVNVPGFLPADKFMKLARYIGDGHLDRGVSWESYSARSGGAK